MPDDVMTDTDLPGHTLPATEPGAGLSPLVIPSESGDTVDDAVEAAATNKRNLDERDEAQIRAANRQRDEAVRRATTAEAGNLATQRQATDTQLAGEMALRTAAIAAKRAAREANDIDAEVKADEDLQARNYNINVLTNRKKQLAQAPAQTRQADPDGPTPEAQRWIDTHPRFNSDPEYNADAIASHNLAVNAGHEQGSAPYIDYIEKRMTKLYGEGHGTMDDNSTRQRAEPTKQPARDDRTSTASPRSSQRSSASGSLEFKHAAGTIRLVNVRDSNGKMRESVEGVIPPSWVEGAKICGMDNIAYAVDQIKIQKDMRDGSLKGLAMNHSGVYE